MQLTQDYRIRELAGTYFVNAPYRILLENTGVCIHDETGELVLDQAACERHNLVPSLELVRRYLRVTLTSRVLHVGEGQSDQFLDENDLGLDDLLVKKFERVESWSSHYFYTSAPHNGFEQKIAYYLEVCSHDSGDGMHFTPSSCPLYKLGLKLTEDEFEACTHLETGTVFTVSLTLLPPEETPTSNPEGAADELAT